MTIREALTQENPGALMYPEQYDAALLGWTHSFGTKSYSRSVAVYSREKLVEILAQDFAKDDEQQDDRDYSDLLMQAEEWIDYNMSGAYLGPDAPVIVVTADNL